MRFLAITVLVLVVSPLAAAEPRVHRGIPYAEPKNPRQMLDLYAPAEGKGHPVVVWIHGGGWMKGDKSSVQKKPQAFADKGYILVSTNYRFVPNVTVQEMTGDIARAIRWVHDHAKEYGGDPNTIFVMGHSAGAHLAALVCTDDRYLKKEGLSLSVIKGCVPVDVSVYDISKRLKDGGAVPPATFKAIFGQTEEAQRELSPAAHAAKGKSIPPFLILHVADRPDTKAQSHWFAGKLKEAGVPARVVAAEGTTHGTINSNLGLPGDRPTEELFQFLSQAREQSKDPASGADKRSRLLPGVEPSGSIRLPNGWSIKPAGKQLELGDFPVQLAFHPSRKWLAALHAGYGAHEIIVVDVQAPKERIVSRTVIEQTFNGLAFSPDGSELFVGGGEFDVIHRFQFEEGFLTRPRKLKISDSKFIPGALAVHPDGKHLYVPGVWGNGVCLLPIDTPEKRTILPLEKDSYPYACLVDAKGKRLYVSLWNKAAVAVIDLDARKVVATWATEKHPTEMVLGPGEKTLFIACSNSTRVSVLNAADGKGLETINCALYANAPPGNTPNSLALTPDGQILFVANADANNVGVFNVSHPGKTKPLGFIPVGMYPTSVRFNPADKRLYVANGRGASTRANPQGPNPLLPKNQTVREYIAGLYRGTLGIVDMPNEESMLAYSKQAYLCSPLREDQGVVVKQPKGNPIPAKVGEPSPIKYCIYVVRENRTYDQVFGDMKEGNGDPNLCIFPEKVTPNAHRLARQFVLLDNFYCEGEVSAEGHEWSMGAYCTDFVKRVWPLSYRGSPLKKMSIYPAEGSFDDIARPAGGYLWDRCAEAKISYRSYGEWIANGKTPEEPGKARVKALEGHFDPWFRGYDLDYPDVKRAERFIAEMRRFEKEGGMPQLSIVRLPNDHTYGTLPKKQTPTAMVAENDLALGLLVEAVSKSKFWSETAIFVVEDDAQNGSDHVDAHRTVALVISPYSQLAKVDSTMYSTASMLRTMELILGLRPMSQFDAAARPMYNSFQAKAQLDPYTHVVPDIDLKAVNTASAWGARLSETFDFSKEDAADDLLFNDVIWRSVRGPDSPMPPPVRAAFVFPHLPKE